VTNGFYNGKAFDMSLGWMLYQPFTNFGSYFQGYMYLNGSQYASGTGLVATVTFQGYNPGPTNILVPILITGITVGRSGGTWQYAPPPLNSTWSRTSADYGNSSYTWVEIAAIPEPSAMALVGLGSLLCVAILRRRRQ
jgi:hypothetical protein